MSDFTPTKYFIKTTDPTFPLREVNIVNGHFVSSLNNEPLVAGRQLFTGDGKPAGTFEGGESVSTSGGSGGTGSGIGAGTTTGSSGSGDPHRDSHNNGSSSWTPTKYWIKTPGGAYPERQVNLVNGHFVDSENEQALPAGTQLVTADGKPAGTYEGGEIVKSPGGSGGSGSGSGAATNHPFAAQDAGNLSGSNQGIKGAPTKYFIDTDKGFTPVLMRDGKYISGLNGETLTKGRELYEQVPGGTGYEPAGHINTHLNGVDNGTAPVTKTGGGLGGNGSSGSNGNNNGGGHDRSRNDTHGHGGGADNTHGSVVTHGGGGPTDSNAKPKVWELNSHEPKKHHSEHTLSANQIADRRDGSIAPPVQPAAAPETMNQMAANKEGSITPPVHPAAAPETMNQMAANKEGPVMTIDHSHSAPTITASSSGTTNNTDPFANSNPAVPLQSPAATESAQQVAQQEGIVQVNNGDGQSGLGLAPGTTIGSYQGAHIDQYSQAVVENESAAAPTTVAQVAAQYHEDIRDFLNDNPRFDKYQDTTRDGSVQIDAGGKFEIRANHAQPSVTGATGASSDATPAPAPIAATPAAAPAASAPAAPAQPAPLTQDQIAYNAARAAGVAPAAAGSDQPGLGLAAGTTIATYNNAHIDQYTQAVVEDEAAASKTTVAGAAQQYGEDVKDFLADNPRFNGDPNHKIDAGGRFEIRANHVQPGLGDGGASGGSADMSALRPGQNFASLFHSAVPHKSSYNVGDSAASAGTEADNFQNMGRTIPPAADPAANSVVAGGSGKSLMQKIGLIKPRS